MNSDMTLYVLSGNLLTAVNANLFMIKNDTNLKFS